MSESPATSGPVLAISDADQVIDLPPDVAQQVFEEFTSVRREWRKWRAIGLGRGRVILINEQVKGRARELLQGLGRCTG